ncbi:TPA: GTP cyclohydrolase I FolE2 [Candidatus Galligastranaerophilus gallistercoris]|nr:GTP cyclohydrolase I FolE2 [Candidatus Galligastranaerophilus gallistercoris]
MNDVQNQKDIRNVEIQKVGVKDVEIPLNIQRKLDNDEFEMCLVYAKAKMSVSLPKEYKGTHMSRFIEVLNEERKKNLVGVDIKKMLETLKQRLNSDSAYAKFDFKYFIKKEAPKSRLQSLMCYDCSFEGIYEKENYTFYLGAKVPITTLCPCSKEISKYGAHNQRALVKVKISYDDDKHIWLEDLIKTIEQSGSSELYSLLKREDEKKVTETAYENPKFVEDVLRDIVIKLEQNEIINSFEVEIEAQESIHNHNAWAYQTFKRK